MLPGHQDSPTTPDARPGVSPGDKRGIMDGPPGKRGGPGSLGPLPHRMHQLSCCMASKSREWWLAANTGLETQNSGQVWSVSALLALSVGSVQKSMSLFYSKAPAWSQGIAVLAFESALSRHSVCGSATCLLRPSPTSANEHQHHAFYLARAKASQQSCAQATLRPPNSSLIRMSTSQSRCETS